MALVHGFGKINSSQRQRNWVCDGRLPTASRRRVDRAFSYTGRWDSEPVRAESTLNMSVLHGIVPGMVGLDPFRSFATLNAR